MHDNFDPQALGITPSECGIDKDNWEQVERKIAEESKTKYRNQLMEKVLRSCGNNPKPKTITDALLNYCVSVTKNVREFMEANPGKKQPGDPVAYPGKMDHTSCITFVVGKIDELSDNSIDTDSSPPLSLSSSSPSTEEIGSNNSGKKEKKSKRSNSKTNS